MISLDNSARGLCGVLLVILAARAGEASASEFLVNPVRLELPATTKSGLLSVENRSRAPVRIQLRAFAWKQGPGGEPQLEPTTDLIVFPTLLTLRASEKRPVRVGLKGPRGGLREESYRIIVEELPEATNASGASLRMITRMSIPIFFQPRSPRGVPALGEISASGDVLVIDLENAGNAHYMATKVAVSAKDARGESLFEGPLKGWYVLPAQPRRYQIALPSGACARLASITLDVQLDRRTTHLSSPARCAAL